MLKWDEPQERFYEHGLDRGVLYIPGLDPVPWNGLISMDEGESGGSTVLYRDGAIYMAAVEASDFKGKVSAMYFPDEFHESIGIPQATDGLYVDNQKPKRFSFGYRSLIGSGTAGDRFGFQIHLIYNAMATISSRQRKTIGDTIEPMTFEFDLIATPVKLHGFRPTAHYIIDTRNMAQSTIDELEALLYGTETTPGRLPTPTELFDLMNFGEMIHFYVYPDGTYKVHSAAKNLVAINKNSFLMKNINAVDHATEAGYYIVSDGGFTDVIPS